MAQIKMQYGIGNITPKVRPLILYKNGVLSDKLGTLGANRALPTNLGPIQGSYSIQPTYIEVNSYRNAGQSGSYVYSIDFENKVEAGKYKSINIIFDLINSSSSYNGSAYLNAVNPVNTRVAEAILVKAVGTYTDQLLILDISNMTQDFYISMAAYCNSNNTQYSTTIRIKELWLEP